MLLRTILNHVEPLKSFAYKNVSFDAAATPRPTLMIEVEHRKNGWPICSGCQQVRPGYDHLPERIWKYVPLWQIPVLLVYALRRVNCPECGVTVEQVPWADGKCRQTTTYRWFLARWAGCFSWKQTAEVFHTSWDSVYRAVRHAVVWGMLHRPVQDVVAIGVDEIVARKGHRYLTLVYQVDSRCRRLLWVSQDRKEDSLREFFNLFGDDIKATVEGLNNKAKVTVGESYGFRTHEGIETALYQALGDNYIYVVLPALLHGLIKKAQKTPASDLNTARSRLAELKERES